MEQALETVEGAVSSCEVQEPRGEAQPRVATRGQNPPMCFLQGDGERVIWGAGRTV